MLAGQATDQPFEQFSQALAAEDKQLLATYKTMSAELTKIVERDQVKLNPRYGNQQIVLLSAQSPQGSEVPLLTFDFQGNADEDTYVTDVSAKADLT
jgi:hypothetical protein